jgi:hypothetical protein
VNADREGVLVVRSSPRIIAPDWRKRIRQIPAVGWAILLGTLLLIAWVGLVNFPGFAIGIALVVLIAVGVFGAKALNARVVIAPDYVESRDALRRSRRCDRSTLASMVLGSEGRLHKVFMVDRDGKVQLRLAWDSYTRATR